MHSVSARKPAWRSYIMAAVVLLAIASALGYLYRDHYPKVYKGELDSSSDSSPDSSLDLSLDGTKYGLGKFAYQEDTEDYPIPKFEVDVLKTYTPKNWRGKGRPTYSLFYATRGASIHEPYFIAVMSLIYRLLWDPHTSSRIHTVVVYVPPFITDLHRDYFKAAGAIVREVGMHTFVPTEGHALMGRLADVMDKLDLWADDDFSLSVYLDADAFPITNLDSLFTPDLAVPQKCKPHLLSNEDEPHADKFCDYVFSAAADSTGLNAGVMVLKPNKQIHSMLMRNSKKQDEYDQGFPEQSLLYHFYHDDGPLPWHEISHAYNGGLDNVLAMVDVFVVHAKLWDVIVAKNPDPRIAVFPLVWQDMLKLYESSEFTELRAENGTDLTAHGKVPGT